MTRFALVSLVFVLLLSGCDATGTDPEPQVVVESYQLAGEPLAPVRLMRTTGIGDRFDATALGISGADVVVERLEDGSVVATTRYAETDTTGRYRALAPVPTVQPGATYRLRATPPDGAVVTSTTTVPSDFRVVEAKNQRAVFQSPIQPSIRVTRSDVEGRQTVFIFTLESQLDFETSPPEDIRDQFTPFYADAFDEDEETIFDYKVNPSPLLNEANYDVNDDGTLTIDVPWIAVAFYGPNVAAINVLDDNYYDFLRTKNAQQQGTPGEIPNVRDRVEGGTGLFGSYVRASVEIEVLRPGAQ